MRQKLFQLFHFKKSFFVREFSCFSYAVDLRWTRKKRMFKYNVTRRDDGNFICCKNMMLWS